MTNTRPSSAHSGGDEIVFIDLAAQRRRLGSAVDKAVLAVLDHGGFILGPEVERLEKRLADFAGISRCLTCSSGTDALALVLMGWNVGRGDAVFVPAFTFAATAEVVAWLGATPVFVDVRADTFNMDVASLECAIDFARRSGLVPRAIIPVDLFGLPADYDALRLVANAHHLRLLADAAQSFGGAYRGKRVGTLGDATAVSFYPAKPLGCYGDGGGILTSDIELAQTLESLRVHGQGSNKYDNLRVGMNGRLDTVQAAVLLQKLAIFEDELKARQTVAERYAALLADVVAVPVVPGGLVSTWAQYTVRVANRNRVIAELAERGVPTAVHYPCPLNEQPAYQRFPSVPGGTPISTMLSREVLSLPMHPYLTAETQSYIAEVLAASVKSNAAVAVGR